MRRRPIDQLIDWLLARLCQGDHVLDLGCGEQRYRVALQKHGVVVVGLDAFSNDRIRPDVVVDMELHDLPFDVNSFDVVLMLDVIEHLTRDTGLEMLQQAHTIAKREVLMLTPLQWDDNAQSTEDPASAYYGNEFNYHRTLWGVTDFEGWERTHLPFTEGKKRYFLGARAAA